VSKKNKKIIILDIISRCPKDKELAFETKCERCEFQGTTYRTNFLNKPRSRKMVCKYKPELSGENE